MTRRAVGAAVFSVLAAFGTTGAGAVPTAPAHSSAPPAAAAPAVRLVSQDAGVAADGSFTVYLDVQDAPAGSELAVDVYHRIEDRDALTAATEGHPQGIVATFAVLPLAKADLATQRTGFSIDVGRPAGPWSYPLREPGAYPVGIRLRGPNGPLSSVVTYLVRTPDPAAAAPGRVALVAEIHQPPGAGAAPGSVPASDRSTTTSTGGGEPDGAIDPADPVDPVWLAQVDALLARLAAHRDVPVSLAVTPDTAAALADDDRADATLSALRRELVAPGRQLLGGTYVDLDVSALVGADLGDEVLRQTDLGRRTLQRILGEEGTDAWLVHDPIDRAAAELLRAVGVAHLLLPAGALGPDPAPGPESLGEGLDLTGLAAEPIGFETAPADPVLAGHQLLGRLAALATIDPGRSGTALWIDPATVDPAELDVVLTGLGTPDGAVRPATADGLFETVPVAEVPAELPGPPDGDLGLYPDRTRRTHDLLGSYASMLADPQPVDAAYEVALARAASRDLDVATRLERLGVVEADLENRLAGIVLPARDRVTLGARDAEFPIRITSRLDQPVRVVVTLEASDRLGLPAQPIVRELAPGSTLLKIPVRTRASGDTPLRIRVTTPDGKVVLAETSYTIRSTAVSGVGLVLTAGAAGFLALWWGRHLLRSRRRRRARHARGAHPDAADGPGPPPGEGPADDVFVEDV